MMKKEEAEKFFGRKASPDSSLRSREFINKKVVQPVKNYGRNVAGGAKIVTETILKALRK